MISIILPTFNEERCGNLDTILTNLEAVVNAEVIVVDGGSTDGSLQRLNQSGFMLLNLPGSHRAARLNHGLAVAKGDCIFLHHPRSLVEASIFEQVRQACDSNKPVWGGLSHLFDLDHPLLRLTSWYSNRIRFDRSGIVYLDHCLFFNRCFIDKEVRVPDLAIFEDTELSRYLGRQCPPLRLSAEACTSAIRFRENGIIRQSIKNQLLKLAYHLKISPQRMSRFYEQGLELNNLIHKE
ncbi:MAG: glycosyltransferase [Gammaproteobacteria bacterium]|nr:glycosyltransferase [Gammaproteobacteria bacterium]